MEWNFGIRGERATTTVQFWLPETWKAYTNAGRIGWVFASWGYMTQQLLSLQNHLSLTLEWLYLPLIFLQLMYLGRVFFT